MIAAAVASLWRAGRSGRGVASRRRPLLELVIAAALAASPEARAGQDDATRPRGPAPDPAIPTLEVLQARGAVIGQIRIVVEEIFDRNDNRENHGLYRLANNLHGATKASTIQAQLLFSEGEKLNASRLEETERVLRGRNYLFDCWVRPVSYDGNKADIEVRVRDVWTLNPGIKLGRTGGKNTTGFDIEEENLFGRGKFIEVARKNDVDRTRTLLEYSDSNVLGSWWQLASSFSDNSDGKEKALFVSHPFYSLATRWSITLNALDSQRIDSRYDLGKVVDQFHENAQRFELSGGRSSGVVNGWTERWSGGARYNRSQFSFAPDVASPTVLPADHKFAYPFVAYDLIEDQYDKTRNQDQIARTEDLYYGIALHAEAGYMTPRFGADRAALIGAASLLTGQHLAPLQSLFTSAAISGRVENGAARNVLLQAAARYYWRFTPKQVFYVALDAAATRALDLDQQLLLGGEEGLRGYPLRYQSGTARALLTLEERYYTDWFPFRLFNVGGAVFFDAGRAWGQGPVSTPGLGLLRDFGVGLRAGNSRSGLGNVVHIDLSYALDGDPSLKKFQVTLQTKQTF